MEELLENTLTDEDRENMRIFLKLVYARNPRVVDNWDMNERVFEIVSDMVIQVIDCSDRMDFVPRPSGVVGANYVKKLLLSIAARVKKGKEKRDREIYFSCRDFVAANYRTALEMAGSGL